jgi:hypothetical protein
MSTEINILETTTCPASLWDQAAFSFAAHCAEQNKKNDQWNVVSMLNAHSETAAESIMKYKFYWLHLVTKKDINWGSLSSRVGCIAASL